MRKVINTIAHVTTTATIHRVLRTVVAGVDALRAAPHHLRLYAAPAPKWQSQFAGKQKPGFGSDPGDGDSSRRMRRESSRCRRPRESSCLARS